MCKASLIMWTRKFKYPKAFFELTELGVFTFERFSFPDASAGKRQLQTEIQCFLLNEQSGHKNFLKAQ